MPICRWPPERASVLTKYLGLDGKLMAVDVKLAPKFDAAQPRPLFESRISSNLMGRASRYAASADGQRFLMNVPVEETATEPMTVVVNWTAGLVAASRGP